MKWIICKHKTNGIYRITDAVNGLTYISKRDAEKVLKAKEWELDYVVRSV